MAQHRHAAVEALARARPQEGGRSTDMNNTNGIAMQKPVKPAQENEITLEEFVARTFFLDIDIAVKNGRRIEVADLFKPEFWAASTKHFRSGDRVRVLSRSQKNFDFFLSVLAVTHHGVLMRPWPCIPQGLETMRAVAHLSQLDHQVALQARVLAPRRTAEAAE
jgi:hypothetical protein